MSSEEPPSSHFKAERTLYQVQVRLRGKARPTYLSGKLIGYDWEPVPLTDRHYTLTDHTDTAAELDDGLFPYALAMTEAWYVLSCRHAHRFEVRLVPHVVKTSYAVFPQEPLPALDPNQL